MKGSSRSKILDILQALGPKRPVDLAKALGISPQALHRQLKRLVDEGHIRKRGSAPLTFYELREERQTFAVPKMDATIEKSIERSFSYLSPSGELDLGIDAFRNWLIATKQEKACLSLAKRYVNSKNAIYEKQSAEGYFDLSDKLSDTFERNWLSQVVVQDFYSLPQFGKTHLGNLVTIGKSGQSIAAIKQVANLFGPFLKSYIKIKKIEQLAWAPHSIPRKIAFLDVLREYVNILLPQIELVKAYSGGIPVAQKSLSKLEDRITNARETIFIKSGPEGAKSVLIIDDALGSGATLNEIASKLKHEKKVEKVYGIAVVGSLKGFDVVSQV